MKSVALDTLTLTTEDQARAARGPAFVTDLATGQQYATDKKGITATPVPVARPRKYKAPELESDKHMTGDLIREIVADYPDEERAHMLGLADLLDARGWIELGEFPTSTLYMTKGKLREIEVEAEKHVREHDDEPVPGFRAEWERTVGVHTYADGTQELSPVTTMYAINPAESDEAAAERYHAVAQEHGMLVGRYGAA